MVKKSISIIIAAIALTACGPNESILKSSSRSNSIPSATLEPRKSTVERELADMRDAGFDYIFIIRRKDGGSIDDEDRRFLRESMPPEVNRRVATDDGKAIILGSGFALDATVVDSWRKRFNVEEETKKVEKVESQR